MLTFAAPLPAGPGGYPRRRWRPLRMPGVPSAEASRLAPLPARGAPPGGERVLREFLRCGLLEHGFARLWCSECRRRVLVAFSFRGRSFCPSREKKRQILWRTPASPSVSRLRQTRPATGHKRPACTSAPPRGMEQNRSPRTTLGDGRHHCTPPRSRCSRRQTDAESRSIGWSSRPGDVPMTRVGLLPRRGRVAMHRRRRWAGPVNAQRTNVTLKTGIDGRRSQRSPGPTVPAGRCGPRRPSRFPSAPIHEVRESGWDGSYWFSFW